MFMFSELDVPETCRIPLTIRPAVGLISNKNAVTPTPEVGGLTSVFTPSEPVYGPPEALLVKVNKRLLTPGAGSAAAASNVIFTDWVKNSDCARPREEIPSQSSIKAAARMKLI